MISTLPAADRRAERDTAARPLRILTLTPFYPSVQDSSQGRFVSEPLALVHRLGISNHTIAVRPFYCGRAHPVEEAPADWTSYLSFPTNAGLSTAGAFLAAQLLRRVKLARATFDLIHAHAALPCGHAAAILAERLSIPFVVSIHGLDAFFTRQCGPLVRSWCKCVAQDVYRSARAVICISGKVRRRVLEDADANTVVIYNGVDPDIFSPARESDPPTVLSVGNLIPTKGHALLLRAYARIAGSIASRLEIIGDGAERARLAQLATQLRISTKVSFHGRQSRTFVAEAMRNCSVFALPSSYEGLGCVYLEAMACAKPTIGCLEQGIDEVIEHGRTGMLISPGSEDELCESLLALLQNRELRRRMGVAARNTIHQRFTVEHQARQLANIYRECAS